MDEQEELIISPIKEDLKSNKQYINYVIDIGIFISFLLVFITGFLKILNLFFIFEVSLLPINISTLHDYSGIFLGMFSFVHLILHFKWILSMTKKIPRSIRRSRKTMNYLIDIGMLVSFLISFITGILKFPGLPISREFLYDNSIIFLLLHDLSGLFLGAFAFTHIVLHWKWIIRMTRKIFRKPKVRKIKNILVFTALISSMIILFVIAAVPIEHSGEEVIIDDIGTFSFNPDEIETVRSDIFQEGHYSVFDILVNLNNTGSINMDYHYDTEMDTYVIDSINGKTNWWLYAYYDGGWLENNVFRMDHYPYKPKMFIRLYQISTSRLNHIYDTFREEVTRRNANNGTVIIPEVIIKSPNNNLNFYDVEVTAHNLRNDFLKDGTITAIDVIMSLGDQGLLTYVLNWYEEIGFAEVKNYYVDGINEDIAYGRCGFVYEAGDLDFDGFSGNHIHIPADIRVITSPEYEEWFWICI